MVMGSTISELLAQRFATSCRWSGSWSRARRECLRAPRHSRRRQLPFMLGELPAAPCSCSATSGVSHLTGSPIATAEATSKRRRERARIGQASSGPKRKAWGASQPLAPPSRGPWSQPRRTPFMSRHRRLVPLNSQIVPPFPLVHFTTSTARQPAQAPSTSSARFLDSLNPHSLNPAWPLSPSACLPALPRPSPLVPSQFGQPLKDAAHADARSAGCVVCGLPEHARCRPGVHPACPWHVVGVSLSRLAPAPRAAALLAGNADRPAPPRLAA